MTAAASERDSPSTGVSDQSADLATSGSILENHQRLAEWVTQHGGFIHPHLQIVYNQNKGYHAIVKEGEVLWSGKRIAKCPHEITLSALNAVNMWPFRDRGTKFPDKFLQKYALATDVLQTFFLMEQYVLGDKSFWSLYLKTLPTIEAVNALQFETDSDIAWIRGTNLEAAFASQNRKWRNQFQETNDMLKSLGWKSARADAYTYELFRWASVIFGSRSFTSQVLDNSKPADIARPLGKRDSNHQLMSSWFSERFAVLLPMLDILNHRPAAKIAWKGSTHGVTLEIQEAYHSGQEIFNNYGPRDNEGLLMSYGFVLEDNPFDHVLISVNAHPGTPLEIARTWPQDERSNDNYNCYIFDINHPIVKEAQYLERALFSYDLLDSISVMCSNDREFQVMYNKRQTLMSSALPTLFDDFRNVLATLAQIMLDAGARAKHTESLDPSRSVPGKQAQTQKQKYAQIYRRKQVDILRAAEGVCAFALLHACTDQKPEDLLLSMQMKLPAIFTPDLQEICTRLPCLTNKHELFSASNAIDLLPSPTANRVRLCLRKIENAILESVPSHMRSHQDRAKTSFTIMLSALCLTHRAVTQLPHGLSVWAEELTSSYPPEDPNWNYVPPPGPYAPGEEPPPALMILLGALPKVKDSIASDDTMISWLEPEMVCWAWNVMEEEGVRVPIEIERFVSEEPAQVDGMTGFLIYCRQA